MNGIITSKNFKATFKFHTDASIESVEFIGTSSEARKFLKTAMFGDYDRVATIADQLRTFEGGLRQYVLAKIGG